MQFGSMQSIARARFLAAGVILALALGLVIVVSGPVQAQAPYLTLIETVPDENVWPPGERTIADGEVTISLHGGIYKVQHTWSSMPSAFDASGFDITFTAAGQVTSNCQPLSGGTGIAGNSFTFSVDPPGTSVNLTPPANCSLTKGASGSNSATVHVTPQPWLSDGSIVELKPHAYYGPGVTYRYRVSNAQPPGWTGPPGPPTPPGPTVTDDGALAGFLECDSDTIVISALPSLNCHIVLTSWRRNTADAVDVSFPAELDGFGNHANGIQLIGRGNEDVFNWVAPRRWGLFVFACPSQQGTGANCYDSITVPGAPVSNLIRVRQGDQTLDLTLTLNPVPHPGSLACGFPLGSGIMAKWRQTGGEGGFLGCATGAEAEAGVSPQGTGGRYALFQNGVIVWHAGGPYARTAFEVHGCIASVYQGMGGTGSWLGFPLSDEYDMPGGRRSDFEGGYIAWNALTGVCNAHRDGSALITLERNVDRPGLDYRSFVPANDSLDLCRDACAAEDMCVAFTYVNPGVQGASAVCWLKSAVPPAGKSTCCTSGVRR